MYAPQQFVKCLSRSAAALLLLAAASVPATDLVVYDDALENSFADFSYTSTGSFDFASTTRVHSGTHSIAFTSSGFDAVKFAAPDALDPATYGRLDFWMYASTAQCNALRVIIEKNAGPTDNQVAAADVGSYVNCATAANTWTEVLIDLGIAPMNLSVPYDRISLFDNSAGFSTVYFDDVALRSAVVDPIFSNGFEGGTTPPPPVNMLTETANQSNGGMNAELFAWYDSNAQQRTAALAYNNGTAGPGGSRGGELRQFSYHVGANVRTVNASSSGAAGFGYVVSHPTDDEHCTGGGDSSSLGHFTPGTWTRVFQGRHHAIFRFQQNYPRYCTTGAAAEHDIPVTIDWMFSTGRDNPLWAISYDLTGVAANTLNDDSRSPYGELLFDGSASEGAHSVIAGVGWGDGYKFQSTTNPVSYDSAWTWNVPNTIPYVKLWTTAIDATMGTVQTQTLAQQDAGGYFDATFWGKTSANGAACAGDEGGHSMPCSYNWDYQSINYSMGSPVGNPNSDTTNNTRLAWGTEFGFLGQSSYDVNGSSTWGGPRGGTTASGYPRKSYSTYIVLGVHSTDAVDAQVAQVENVQTVALAASVGSVASSGAAGVNRSDTISYSPNGYDPVYGALTFVATANAISGTISVGAAKTLKNPLIVIRNYTAATYPSSVKFGGSTLTMDADYFPSLRADKNELWITLNKNVTGSGNAFQVTP